MFAMLGNIPFFIKNAPTAISETHQANFAEHQVLSGKAQLQRMPLSLQEFEFYLHLHFKLGNVEQAYLALLQALEEQAPLPLMIGNSRYKGKFVIVKLTSQTLTADTQGNALEREVQLSLKESIEKPQAHQGKAMMQKEMPPVLAKSLNAITKVTSQAREVMNKGLKVAKDVQNAYAQVQSIANLVKQVKHNPLGVLNALPEQLEGLGVVTESLCHYLPNSPTHSIGDLASGMTESLGGMAGSCEAIFSNGRACLDTLNGLKNDIANTIEVGTDALAGLVKNVDLARTNVGAMAESIAEPANRLLQTTLSRLDIA